MQKGGGRPRKLGGDGLNLGRQARQFAGDLIAVKHFFAGGTHHFRLGFAKSRGGQLPIATSDGGLHLFDEGADAVAADAVSPCAALDLTNTFLC